MGYKNSAFLYKMFCSSISLYIIYIIYLHRETIYIYVYAHTYIYIHIYSITQNLEINGHILVNILLI